MAREGLQDGRIAWPFLEHLRRRLDEVIFEVAGRPFRISAQDSMQQMTVLMEKGYDVFTFHQARSVGGLGEVTH